MAETLICIRGLQQVPALPVTVYPSAVGYIVIYVIRVQVLVPLFRTVVHPRRATRKVRIGPDIEIHLLLSRDKDIVDLYVVIYRKPVRVQGEIADVRFEQASPEMNRSLPFQAVEPLPDVLPGTYLLEPLFRDRLCRDIHDPEAVIVPIDHHYVPDDFGRPADVAVQRVCPVRDACLEQPDQGYRNNQYRPRAYGRKDKHELVRFVS